MLFGVDVRSHTYYLRTPSANSATILQYLQNKKGKRKCFEKRVWHNMLLVLPNFQLLVVNFGWKCVLTRVFLHIKKLLALPKMLHKSILLFNLMCWCLASAQICETFDFVIVEYRNSHKHRRKKMKMKFICEKWSNRRQSTMQAKIHLYRLIDLLFWICWIRMPRL